MITWRWATAHQNLRGNAGCKHWIQKGDQYLLRRRPPDRLDRVCITCSTRPEHNIKRLQANNLPQDGEI